MLRGLMNESDIIYRLENDKDYLNGLFHDCYYNDINCYEEFKSIQPYLHLIARKYCIIGCSRFERPEFEIFLPVAKILYKLSQENRLDNIKNILLFLFVIDKFGMDVEDILNILIDPRKSFNESNENYIEFINEIFWKYSFMYQNRRCNYKYNIKLHDILECYMNYCRTLKNEYDKPELRRLCAAIGGLCNISDMDISTLDNIYKNLFENFDDILDRYILNSNVETNDMLQFALYVLNNDQKPIKIIK